MKIKGKLILTGILIVAFVIACLPASAYATIYQSVFSPYSNMTEEEIFNSKKNADPSELISEITALEKALPAMDDKSAITPHLMALIEMEDEFTATELITLIKDPETDVGLDSAFVQMYVNKGAESSELIPLLSEDGIAKETKEYIAALGDFSTAELSEIFSSSNDNVAVIAMKRIAVLDDELALELVLPMFSDTKKALTDEEYISAFLGAAEYCENHMDGTTEEAIRAKELKKQIIPIMKNIYNTSSNDLLKDQAIYAMARMADYDVFTYIIESEDIDFDLKVSTIERNVDLMIEQVSTATTLDEIDTIITAMNLHPIIEVGEALEMAVAENNFVANKNVFDTIDFIESNGIERVNKYEKG